MHNVLYLSLEYHTEVHCPKNALCSIYSSLLPPQILGNHCLFYCLYNFAFPSIECIYLVLMYRPCQESDLHISWNQTGSRLVQDFT